MVAGTYGATATYGGDETSYASSSGSDPGVTIGPAPLTITASSGSFTYGGTPPAITANYSGFVNGNTAASLTTQPSCSTTATSTSAVSSYPSSCSGASDPNYTISYVDGSVTVKKAPLKVTASDGSFTYGGTPPAITASYAGFVNGDSASSLTTKPTCSTTATSSSPVAGSPYASSCSGAADPNYTFSYTGGTVTVNPASLFVTRLRRLVHIRRHAAGDHRQYAGFVNGDSASSLTTKPTCSTTATSSSPVVGSPYPSSCSGAADSNYVITYTDGSVTVNPATLTVTASNGSMTYGGTPPTITAKYAGFVNGDTLVQPHHQAHVLDHGHELEPGRRLPVRVVVLGAADPNYSIKLHGRVGDRQPGPPQGHSLRRLVHLRRHSADDHRQLLGLRQRRHGSSSLTTKPTCSTTATSSSPVVGSPYASSCSGAADSNYTFSYTGGTVTVNPASLFVTASDGSFTYGGTPPTITAKYAGFVNGDTGLQPHHQAHVLDHGHELEPGLRLPVPVVLLGGGRLELRHHLHRRVGDGEPRHLDRDSLRTGR